MSAEIPSAVAPIILDVLNRHETGFDVYDTFRMADDDPDKIVRRLRTIVGPDLTLVFNALAGIHRITPTSSMINDSNKLTYH